LDRERLVNAIIRLRKRLGGAETQDAIHHLIHDNVRESFKILLRYYDKFYAKSMQKKESPDKQIITIKSEGVDEIANTEMVLNAFQEMIFKR
jgi:tRNA 2-selenouridine synthase